MAAEYRVLVYAYDGTANFGVGDLLVEFENVKNLGWGRYLNEVSEAFWTINQDDPKLSGLRGHKGRNHVQVIRNGETVFRGVWAEHDATGEDVIFYAYGYESYLYSLQSDWNKLWTDTEIGTIVSDLWTYAKTTLTFSPVAFVATGTIQAPVTTSGGAVPITLPLYRIFHKRILFALKELAAVSMSDTTNTVFFEMAHSLTPSNHAVTFNFWKNNSTDRPEIRWEYPNGAVHDFSDEGAPVLNRNVIPVVGAAPNNLLLRHTESRSSGAWGYEQAGRRSEPIFLSWVRDEEELQRIAKLRLARAVRAEPEIRLFLHPDTALPPGVTGAGYSLGDQVKVKLARGITQLDQYMQVTGVQVLFLRGVEYVNPWLMEKPGT